MFLRAQRYHPRALCKISRMLGCWAKSYGPMIFRGFELNDAFRANILYPSKPHLTHVCHTVSTCFGLRTGLYGHLATVWGWGGLVGVTLSVRCPATVATVITSRLGCQHVLWWEHYNDVIMSEMASQITSVSIVCSTIYSGADQRKQQSSASLAFVRVIHRWPMNYPHKRPVTREMFPFGDVIMKNGMITSPCFDIKTAMQRKCIPILKFYREILCW